MPFVMGAASDLADSEGEYKSEDTVLLGDESMSGRASHSAQPGLHRWKYAMRDYPL